MFRKATVLIVAIAIAATLAVAGAGAGSSAVSDEGPAKASGAEIAESGKTPQGSGGKARNGADAKEGNPADGGADAGIGIMQRLVEEWDAGEPDEADGVPMEDLSFPVDHFDDGTVKAQFYAKWALMPNDQNAFVRARGVVVELYDEEGHAVGYFKAEKCIYDRATQTGYSEGKVRMEYHAPDRNIRIDGFDMQWNLATRNAKILREPKVTMSEIMGNLGGSFRK